MREGSVKACYEAGAAGYDLYRRLTALGVACDVIAPVLTPRRSGQRIKTDRRDAAKLVRLFRAGELTPIHTYPMRARRRGATSSGVATTSDATSSAGSTAS